jgi:hypothetical protein
MDCRQLIAERLAAAGRQHGQHVAAAEHGVEDRRLHRPHTVEAENGAQRVMDRDDDRFPSGGQSSRLRDLPQNKPKAAGS